VNLADHMLQSVRKVLLVGRSEGLRALLEERGLEAGNAAAAPSYPKGHFDCALVERAETPLEEALQDVLPFLSPFATVYLAFAPGTVDADELGGLLAGAGLRPYVYWHHESSHKPVAAADPAPHDVVMAVPQTYDPVAHARALFKARHPEWALEVLTNVPEDFLGDAESYAHVAAEKELCLLALDRMMGARGRLNRFASAQREFYRVTTLLPYHHPAYFCHAEFWHVLGNDDMAARVLRTIGHVAPRESVDRRLRSYRHTTSPPPPDETAPAWSGAKPPRILMLCHEHPDYGFDTLYDGLCTVLGPDAVLEFPWKPSLHGRAPEIAKDYPCTFDLPGEPLDIEAVCRQLREGRFDWVFYTDTLLQLERDMVRPLIEAASSLPLFILDTWDDCGDYLDDVLSHIGRDAACACFKREMLACADYGPNTFPMPFSYADGRTPGELTGERPEALFWAGKRQDGMRRVYLPYIEAKFGLKLDANYPQKAYVQAIERARIGLNLFGLGFDTVRYWELPAHGCMLLSERPPIRIPHNFRDGESAVFFDDAADLEAKLAHYLAHPEQTEAIAAAGRRHFSEYHTASARARQLLGRVEEILNGMGVGRRA